MEYSTKISNKRIKKHAEEMPIELRRAIGSLSDEVRLAIFFALFKYGEMSFSQIRQELEIPTNYSGYLSYHLKKLENSALIKNDYSKKTGITNYSFYDVTEFGEKLIDGIMKSIEVDSSIKEKLEAHKLVSNATGFTSYDMVNINDSEETQMPVLRTYQTV